MTDAIKHRGPDDEGYYLYSEARRQVFKGPDTHNSPLLSSLPDIREKLDAEAATPFVALGHRRLSIIDTSPNGHQPMETKDQRFAISYNGEVYNFKEIRKELESMSVNFRSASDTEVIIESFRAWGINCVRRFNGMFAFIIFDSHTGDIFGARDRFGIKPFYYQEDDRGTVFGGSEIKQLALLKGSKLNHQTAYDYLTWGQTDFSDQTLFKDINQLPAGSLFTTNISRPSIKANIRRYYTLERNKEISELPYDEAVRIYKEQLTRSVSLRLRADVPVGTCLSGGLDSSSIVSLVENLRKENSNAETHTFSSCSHESKYDEQPFIDLYKNKPKIRQHKTFPDPKRLFEELDQIIWHHDEPFLSTSVFAEWSVFDLVKKTGNVKVTLDGHGADEQLLGYHTFIPSLLGTHFRNFDWLALIKEARYLSRLHKYSAVEIIRKTGIGIFPVGISKWLLNITGRLHTEPAWLGTLSLENSQSRSDFITDTTASTIDRTSCNQITKTSIPKQLKWCDRDSMAKSIESRVPFLDHELVEFTTSLPATYRFKNGITKRVLRDSMRGILPEKIRLRMDKMGFVTPEESWIKNSDTALFMKATKDAISYSDGIINESFLAHANSIAEGRKPFDRTIWRTICFGNWMKVFNISA